jgi:hypothetical protein
VAGVTAPCRQPVVQRSQDGDSLSEDAECDVRLLEDGLLPQDDDAEHLRELQRLRVEARSRRYAHMPIAGDQPPG